MISHVNSGMRRIMRNIKAVVRMPVSSKKRPAKKAFIRQETSEATAGTPPAFICVECGYSCGAFQLTVSGIHSGALCYIAKCPSCGSRMVKPLPGFYEHDLWISTKGNKAPKILHHLKRSGIISQLISM